MSLDDAPLSVRRDFYSRERQNSALAIALIVLSMLLMSLPGVALLDSL
jgi:hypothetical protein